MSDLNINNITDRTGNAGPIIAGVSTVSSTGAFTVPVGPTEMRGGRGRAVIAGGFSPSIQTVMEYLTIATTGNGTEFGNMSRDSAQGAIAASSTRGVVGGYRSNTPSPNSMTSDMKYFTFSSGGGVSDFGDFNVAMYERQASGNNTRGIFFGGILQPVGQNVIEYITMASTGDASEFGDLNYAGSNCHATIASPTRAVNITGAYSQCVIEYVTIATTGNAVHFGTTGRWNAEPGGASNSIRGIFSGGYVSPALLNIIEYITIATEGNTVDFGDLPFINNQQCAAASSTRCCLIGGNAGLPNFNAISYVTIASTGNALDFGDLTTKRGQAQANSDVHGGIG